MRIISPTLYTLNDSTLFRIEYFGIKYVQPQDLVDTCVESPTSKEVMDGVKFCRDAKDVCAIVPLCNKM